MKPETAKLAKKILLPEGVLYSALEFPERGTGLSVFVFPKGLTSAALVLGGGPGTRETDVVNAADKKLYGLVFSGGSAMGLEAASGVARYLQEIGTGHETRFGKVPIVASAVVYDLFLEGFFWPTLEDGRKACDALTGIIEREGDFGAGFATMCNKKAGFDKMIKSGIGAAEFKCGEIKGSAYVVNNAIGVVNLQAVVDYLSERNIAAAPTVEIASLTGLEEWKQNTILSFICLNLKASKEELRSLAEAASQAIPEFIYPAFTERDGDVIFVSSVGDLQSEASLSELGALCKDALKEALIRSTLFSSSNSLARSIWEFLRPI